MPRAARVETRFHSGAGTLSRPGFGTACVRERRSGHGERDDCSVGKRAVRQPERRAAAGRPTRRRFCRAYGCLFSHGTRAAPTTEWVASKARRQSITDCCSRTAGQSLPPECRKSSGAQWTRGVLGAAALARRPSDRRGLVDGRLSSVSIAGRGVLLARSSDLLGELVQFALLVLERLRLLV